MPTLIERRASPSAAPCPVGGCGGPVQAPVPPPPPGAPVRVDGASIAEADIAREMQHHPGADGASVRAEAARALVIRHLLLRRAGELGLSPAPETDELGRWESDEEALIRQLLEQEAPPLEPTEAEVRRFYAARGASLDLSYDRAAPLLADRLRARAWATAASRYVAALARAARIEGVQLFGDGAT